MNCRLLWPLPAPARTEHVLLLDGKSSAGGFLLPSLCSLHSSRSYFFFFFSSPPLESAVHLTPQIAYDSRAISSPGFELNWSEQYHLCLLKGRSGSRCCSAERNQEEREGWWMVDGGWGEHGGQKSCYLQPSKPQFHMQSAQLAPLWGGLSCSLLFIPHLALSPGELLPLSARTLYLPGSCHLFFPPSSLFRHPSLSHFLLLSLFQRAVPEDSREMNVVSL